MSARTFLWIVRTGTNPMAAPPPKPIRQAPQLGGCSIIATRRRGAVWESLVLATEGRSKVLQRLPDVVGVSQAEEGVFSDKSFGTITISEGGTRYSFENPIPQNELEVKLRYTKMAEPRWRERLYRSREDSPDPRSEN